MKLDLNLILTLLFFFFILELKNDLDHVKFIYPSVKNINYQNPDGRTILHKAITYGRLGIIRWLLEHGRHKIDLQIKDRYGRTVLREAKIQYLVRDEASRKTIFQLINSLYQENNSR